MFSFGGPFGGMGGGPPAIDPRLALQILSNRSGSSLPFPMSPPTMGQAVQAFHGLTPGSAPSPREVPMQQVQLPPGAFKAPEATPIPEDQIVPETPGWARAAAGIGQAIGDYNRRADAEGAALHAQTSGQFAQMQATEEQRRRAALGQANQSLAMARQSGGAPGMLDYLDRMVGQSRRGGTSASNGLTPAFGGFGGRR